MASTGTAGHGLGNRALLDRIDKLRELGISDLVPLPQMVVVGDQSAGKSSVLESLTGFHFPRSVSLCTRHATEIVCRREPTENITVSIISYDNDPERAELVKKFRRETAQLDSEEFGKIFKDAAKVMGIKSDEDDDSRGSAFSQDVLRVEISGPRADHLTIIDVPGMFETSTPGLTTEGDILLVKSMVKRYIQEPRTIILAVVPCTGDIANQKILRYAAEADPEGRRTLGVLTKPDLATEKATKAVICDLINGKRRDLQLGYCVVRNRGADDLFSDGEVRNQKERELFSEEPWKSLPADRLGIPALRTRIQQVLMDRTRSEFPAVRKEIALKLEKSQQYLDAMGDPRSTSTQQRAYIGEIASKFTRLKNFGLDAHYTRDEFFDDHEMRLITRIRTLNEAYSLIMHRKGHTREFGETKAALAREDVNQRAELLKSGIVGRAALAGRSRLYDGMIGFHIPSLEEKELDRIIRKSDCCDSIDEVDDDDKSDIFHHLQVEYLASRGREIGTFSSELLPQTFKQQAKKWKLITRAHVSNVILVVHHFLCSAIEHCCPDDSIRQELWAFLGDSLRDRYARAMKNAEFLISVEFEGKCMTLDPTLEKMLREMTEEQNQNVKALRLKLSRPEQICLASLDEMLEGLMTKDDTSVESMRQKVHDVMYAYYGIARSRFIDVVCQQAIDYFLLSAADGPLAVLSDQVVLQMTDGQLDRIAGEDAASQAQRERVTKEIEMLSKALEMMRG